MLKKILCFFKKSRPEKIAKEHLREHFVSSEYWDSRYKSGGNSGAGSYGRLALFKAEVINAFIEKNKINKVIEFGCGDGNQLELFKIAEYLGLDVSHKAVEMNRSKYANDSTKTFQLLSDYSGNKAELVLSLDVIYHLIEDSVFHGYMESLFKASNRFVCVYASNMNNDNNTAVHVKHRTFTDWISKNRPEWKCAEFIPNKYPWDQNDEKNTSFADFYFYEKIV